MAAPKTWGTMDRTVKPKPKTWGTMDRTVKQPGKQFIPLIHSGVVYNKYTRPKADEEGIYGGNKKRRRRRSKSKSKSKSKKVKSMYRRSIKNKKQRKSNKNRR